MKEKPEILTAGKLIEILKNYPENTKIIGYSHKDFNKYGGLTIREFHSHMENTSVLSITASDERAYPLEIGNYFEIPQQALLIKTLFDPDNFERK